VAEGSHFSSVVNVSANVHSIMNAGTVCYDQGSFEVQSLQGGRYVKISRVIFVSENLKADSDCLVA
jgi:hypothetical protein